MKIISCVEENLSCESFLVKRKLQGFSQLLVVIFRLETVISHKSPRNDSLVNSFIETRFYKRMFSKVLLPSFS